MTEFITQHPFQSVIVLICAAIAVLYLALVFINAIITFFSPSEGDPFVGEILDRAWRTGNVVVGTRNEDGTYTITEYPLTPRKSQHESIGEGTDPETPKL